jgi:hypothetical protein
MPKYYVKTIVEYWTEEEFDNEEEAEKAGWNYEEWSHSAEVYSIDVEELPEEVEDEEDDFEEAD